MRTPCMVVCALLLLFAAASSLLDVKSASALKVATQWGYLYPNPPAGEQNAEMWICDQIYWYFYNQGWAPSNAWGEYTQQGYVLSVLQYCQYPYNNVDWATIWWVGDFKPDGNYPPKHRACYGYNNQHIWDYNVYAYANYYWWPPPNGRCQPIPSKQYFSFIWTCANGGLYFDSNGNTWNVTGITAPDVSVNKPTYIPINPFTKYGYVENPYSTPPTVVGMPYGFTGTLSMSTDGYHSPSGSYCYIGWENISPFMVNPTNYNGKFYKDFVNHFYRYALGIDYGPTHHTIKQSLDYATLMTLGIQSLDDTTLYSGYWDPGPGGWWYCRLRVYGNSNLILPY
ncbi:MAG: hypothetical protein QXP44_04445 [Candidatus Bathyarchaeia archaeon]